MHTLLPFCRFRCDHPRTLRDSLVPVFALPLGSAVCVLREITRTSFDRAQLAGVDVRAGTGVCHLDHLLLAGALRRGAGGWDCLCGRPARGSLVPYEFRMDQVLELDPRDRVPTTRAGLEPARVARPAVRFSRGQRHSSSFAIHFIVLSS